MIQKDDVFFTFSPETIEAITYALTGRKMDTIRHSGMDDESIIMHIGQLYRSGRFPWGSGLNPFQRHGNFATWQARLKAMGMTDKEIADEMGVTVPRLRVLRQEMNEYRKYSVATEIIPAMKEQGLSDQQIADMLNEMGKEYGFSTNRQTIKNWQDSKKVNQAIQDNNDLEVLRRQVKEHGYLEVGKGVEVHLGMSKTRLDSLVSRLADEEGIFLYNQIQVPQMTNPDQKTTVKILSTNPDRDSVRENIDKITLPEGVTKIDGMLAEKPPVGPPELLARNRVAIRYGDADLTGDGITGSDQDGIIEIRRGAKGLDLGRARYAQVRIGVEGDMYMKGMAIYSDNLPPGVDVVYNTNRPVGTPDLQPDGKSGQEVFKKMKGSSGESANHRFGAAVNDQRGALNILAEEGNWGAWSKNLSTQFLSKQPMKLVNERLDATRQDYMRELEEINSLTNPVVRQKMLEDFSGRMITASQHMKAKAMPDQVTHVIMPIPQMPVNQVYAPNYPNGTRLALVRYPHGATFEIPELIVNNNNRPAKNLLGNARDALGIHPQVAEQLSGADFDGDTVVAIPNNDRRVRTQPAVDEVINFNNKIYQDHNMPESRRMKKGDVQMQMGMASNLITDMTVRGATQEEIIRAVQYSMVVIDAHKHVLDYKRAYNDFRIRDLEKKYQKRIHPVTGKEGTRGGAATLFSRSGDSKIVNPNHDPDRPTNNNPRDRNYNPYKITLAEWARNQPGGAQNLVSLDGGTEVEQVYAAHSNNTMGISRQAQADADRISLPPKDRNAAREYADAVASLEAKLNRVLANKPIERAAQLRANAALRARDTQGLTEEEMTKLRNTLIKEARNEVGARSQQIEITDREWEAIQAQAMSSTMVKNILNYADMEQVIERSMPRSRPTFSESQMVRMRQMHQQGRTWGEIAEAMGTSVTTVVDIMGERNPELFNDE